jgi:DNA-binding FadR family transcriptional regulator
MAAAESNSAARWKPLARLRTHEMIVAEIESQLSTGELKVGHRLPPERQFAEVLGVSRGAVREALRILEAVGVLKAGTGAGPSSGSVIVSRDVSGMAMVLRMHLHAGSFSADDLVEVRQLLEDVAARKAAEAAENGYAIAELRSLVDRMSLTQDYRILHDLQADFHSCLLQMSENALAVMLAGAMSQSVPPSATPETGAQAEEYAAIVDAIAAGDGQSAARQLAAVWEATRQPTGLSRLRRVS